MARKGAFADPKFCRRCEEWKPRSKFHPLRKGSPYVHSLCGPCSYKEVAEYAKAKNKRYRRNYYYLWAGNSKSNRIPRTQYEDMLRAQGGACKICRKTEPGRSTNRRFCVDHDHVTGKIRGLLCHDCNTGIAHFKENVAFLGSAMEYIQEHSPRSEVYVF